MAGCATPTSSDGHAPDGAATSSKLTFQADHLVGAGQADYLDELKRSAKELDADVAGNSSH